MESLIETLTDSPKPRRDVLSFGLNHTVKIFGEKGKPKRRDPIIMPSLRLSQIAKTLKTQ